MTPISQKTIDEQLEYLRKGTLEIIPENELRAKLEKSEKTGRPLRIKLGVDPTAPDIHLEHTVLSERKNDPRNQHEMARTTFVVVRVISLIAFRFRLTIQTENMTK